MKYYFYSGKTLSNENNVFTLFSGVVCSSKTPDLVYKDIVKLEEDKWNCKVMLLSFNALE